MVMMRWVLTERSAPVRLAGRGGVAWYRWGRYHWTACGPQVEARGHGTWEELTYVAPRRIARHEFLVRFLPAAGRVASSLGLGLVVIGPLARRLAGRSPSGLPPAPKALPPSPWTQNPPMKLHRRW